MKRLFLLEFFISKIKIESSVPQFRSIAVHLFSDKVLDLKIAAEEFEADRGVRQTLNHLFPMYKKK